MQRSGPGEPDGENTTCMADFTFCKVRLTGWVPFPASPSPSRCSSGRGCPCPSLEILEEARALGRGSPLVFPSLRGKPLDGTAFTRLLKRLGIKAVPHGFRSSFRDWAVEEAAHPREVA